MWGTACFIHVTSKAINTRGKTYRPRSWNVFFLPAVLERTVLTRQWYLELKKKILFNLIYIWQGVSKLGTLLHHGWTLFIQSSFQTVKIQCLDKTC